MKKYKFLLKPLFFIFSLLFSSWLVLKIEKVQPSDFGKHTSFFQRSVQRNTHKLILSPSTKHTKERLKKICLDYKAGLIDNATLDWEISLVLKDLQQSAERKKIK